MNDEVYVPSFTSGNCAYISSSDVLRVYDSVPQSGRTITYKDYYLKSHYIYNTGSTTFSQYSTLPTCISSERITTNVFYRNDLMDILIVFFIILLICFYFPYRIISRIFGGWLKW